MRSFVTIAVFASGALAAFNPKICNGAGGCVGSSAGDGRDPFVCPDGTRLNLQQTASNAIDSGNGGYEIASKDEFPTICLDGTKPADGDVLTVRKTEFGQKMYSVIKQNCTTKTPRDNCYNFNDNGSSSTLCQLIDSKGKECVRNPNAGECEAWGGSTVRPQCNYWKPGLPDLPRQG